ncbi:MAG: beta-galactosidase trimerization domain-containing protein [Bacillota bacterium]
MKRLNIRKNGKDIFPVGVNYWASHAGHLMWKDWDPNQVKEDMKILEDLGLNTVRSFFITSDLCPYPGKIVENELEKFKEFLDICEEHNINVFPSIFVGHMSGTNWDIPWRNGRDFCGDTFMIYHESNLVRKLVKRFNDHSAITAWILSNELPNYTGSMKPEKATVWLKAMYQAVKEGDPDALVSPGDGARTTAKKNYDGFRVEWIKNYVDYFGVHLYSYFDYENGDNDDLRLSYQIPCRIRYVQLDKPVLLEEFGVSDLLTSQKKAAGYYRNVIYSSWINGSSGAVSWCSSDFDLKKEVPYEFQPHELFFGIIDKEGNVKATGKELSSFANFAKEYNIKNYNPERAEAAIFIPYWMYEDLPSHGSINRLLSYRIFEQAFTWSKMAGFELDFIRDLKDIENYKLIILPAIARLKSYQWDIIKEWVENGGNLYLSYSSANGGLLIPNYKELIGIELDLNYGKLDMGAPGNINYKVLKEFGTIKKGQSISSFICENNNKSAFLPINAKEAEVLMVNKKTDDPILIRNKSGSGQTFFATRPIEYDALKNANSNEKSDSYLIYKAIANSSGVKLRWENKPTSWEINIQENQDEKLLVIINHIWEKKKGEITDKLKNVSLNLTMGPQAVAVFRETDFGWEKIHSSGFVDYIN